MSKKLSEMTLEELWQLFPIFLTQHQKCWKDWYLEEERVLKEVLSPAIRISHIGSTAIPSIWAKPIVDILAEVPKECRLSAYKAQIKDAGYLCMAESPDSIFFNKGYTENGFADRVFHLHLKYAGDNNELYFRDYLIEHPEAAKEYEELKLTLWKKYEHDRDGYTNSKAELVRRYTKLARMLYGNRY